MSFFSPITHKLRLYGAVGGAPGALTALEVCGIPGGFHGPEGPSMEEVEKKLSFNALNPFRPTPIRAA